MSYSKTGYLPLFKHKNYNLIFISNGISSLGITMFQVAFFWHIYKLTSSPFIAGLALLGNSLPYLVFGLIGGVYADRWDRKKVTLWGAVITIPCVLIIPLLSWIGFLEVWHVSILTFLIMSIRCFTNPAIRALVPQTLPEHLWPSGNSIFQVAMQIARSIGPALAGILIAQFSAMVVFLLYAGLLLISIVFLVAVNVERVKKKEQEISVFQDIVETHNYIRPIKPLYWSIIMFGLVLLIITGIERIGLPQVSDQVWDMSSEGFGNMLALFGVGNILGALILGKVQIKKYSNFIFLGWVLWGISFGIIGLTNVFFIAIMFGILVGVAESMNDLPMVLMIQKFVPDDKLGKVFSMWTTVAFIGESGSTLLAGMILGIFSLQTSFMFVAVSLTLIGVVSFVLIEFVFKNKATDEVELNKESIKG